MRWADDWYYAEGQDTRGPVSLAALVPILAKTAKPGNVLVWRPGMADWQAAASVPEIAGRLSSAPADRPTMTPASNAPGVPAPEGIGGWLVLVAIGQVLGPLRTLVSIAAYYANLDARLFQQFPAAAYGEVLLNAAMFVLVLSTSILFFRKSRKFPRFFIIEWIAIGILPLLNAAWAALTISLYAGLSFSSLMSLDPQGGVQIAAAIIVGRSGSPTSCNRAASRTRSSTETVTAMLVDPGDRRSQVVGDGCAESIEFSAYGFVLPKWPRRRRGKVGR